jgi:enhancing lycopene biosynthesis protein 2
MHETRPSRAVLKRTTNTRCIVFQVLCGCGSLDGSEISESISTAIHLCQRNIKPQFYCPDVEICGVINHFTGELDIECPERNALVESARLARSCIKPLCECYASKHAALIIPGGLGAVRTLYVRL